MTDFELLCLGEIIRGACSTPPARPANDNRRGQGDGVKPKARRKSPRRLRQTTKIQGKAKEPTGSGPTLVM